jgi:hypothetical protein
MACLTSEADSGRLNGLLKCVRTLIPSSPLEIITDLWPSSKNQFFLRTLIPAGFWCGEVDKKQPGVWENVDFEFDSSFEIDDIRELDDMPHLAVARWVFETESYDFFHFLTSQYKANVETLQELYVNYDLMFVNSDPILSEYHIKRILSSTEFIGLSDN